MPLELGYDLGAKAFGGSRFAGKKILVLEEEPRSAHRAASDLSGCDFESHKGDARKMVTAVRGWLVNEAGALDVGASALWEAFNAFQAWNYDELTKKKWKKTEINKMGMGELTGRMKTWLKENPLI